MKLIRFLGKFFLAFFLITLVLWTFILGTLQTKTGQEWVINKVTNYLESSTGTQIQVKKFHFSFPLNLVLENVTILQDSHPLITIENFKLCCAYTKLLQGRVIFSGVQATDVDILQIPLFAETAISETPISWETPLLPFYVKLDNIDIQRLKLKPQILHSLHLPEKIEQLIGQSSLNLNGVISNNPFKSALTAHILITAKSEVTDLTPFSLGLDTQNHQMSLSIHFNQLPLQVLQSDLPSDIKAHLAFYASAPVATWQSLVQNPSQENLPLEGHFKLTLNSTLEDPSLLSKFIGSETILRSHYLLKSRDAIELVDLKIENSIFHAIGDGILTSDQRVQQGHFRGEFNDLKHFQALIGKELEGKLTFEGNAVGPCLQPSLNLHLESPHLVIEKQLFQNIHSNLQTSIQSNSLNGSFTLAFDYQGIPWTAASAFDYYEYKKLTFSQLHLHGLRSGLQGELSCMVPDFIWNGRLEANVSDFNHFSQFLTTPISGEGQLNIQLAAIDVKDQKRQKLQAEVIGHSINMMDVQAQQMHLHLDMDPINEGVEFFQVSVSLEGKEVKWKDYFVEYGIAHSLHKVDIFQRRLSDLTAEWKAQNIQWANGKAAEVTGKTHLQKVQFHNAFETLEGQIDVVAHQVHTPALQFQELAASTSFKPSQSQWPFHIKGKGLWKEDLLFDIEGSLQYLQEMLEVQIQHLSGSFGPYPLQLKQPVLFTSHPDKTQLTGLWLQWGEGEIQAEFNQEHQNFSSHFKTNALPSELFHFIAPELPLAGRATFQGHLEGAINQPKGQFQIDLHNIQIIEDIFANKPFIAGRLLLNLDEKSIQLKSELNGVGHTPLQIAGQLPLELSLNPFSFKIDPQLPFALTLNAEGELDPYLHLFYNDTANLSGHTKIALTLSGQLNNPQMKGHIDLINGAFESLSTGALYHNIQAHLEGDGAKINLTQFSAQDSKNGQISGTGIVHLDASKQFPFEFQIHPSHIFIIDSDYVDISASGRLNLIGNMQKSKLQGELSVDQANIHLEEKLPHQIKNIDIKYFNIAEGDSLPNYFEKHETSSNLELDVTLNAIQNISIQDKHLKSEWKGAVVITGTPETPQLNGDLRIAKGEYNLNGKIFQLSHGNIHFAGPVDKKTTLYVVARKEIDQMTAEIIVKGPVTKPVISFRSNPPLSQREVLSYILFNRGISDITSDQGEQLSQSFMSLNTSDQSKSSDDILSRLRNKIGIDHLDFTSNGDKENKDFGLQVGKHITENVMVTVNQSMTTLSPIIAVEAKLHKNIKAQAEAGVAEDSPIRMSIKWKKDY